MLLRVGGIYVEKKSAMRRSEVREMTGKDKPNMLLTQAHKSNCAQKRGQALGQAWGVRLEY